MKSENCPYCMETIKEKALICKYCNQRLYIKREEVVMAAIFEKIRFVANATFTEPSVSACGAFCYSRFSHHKVMLNQCLDNCKAAQAAALVAEKIQGEILGIFSDLVWGGGDIDPLPLEKAVRERISKGGITDLHK